MGIITLVNTIHILPFSLRSPSVHHAPVTLVPRPSTFVVTTT